MKDLKEIIKSALFGVAIGDALGVPVEFNSRATLMENPVTDMIGYGTFNLPEGTFSDDSSLTFCLAEALTQEFDLNIISKNFIKWRYENYWTPHGSVFDIGILTNQSIQRLKEGIKPELAGGYSISSNGNGSLMRILPLIFYIKDKSLNERFEITKKVSSITHGHIRSVISCFYYLEFARKLIQGYKPFEAYQILKKEISNYLNTTLIEPTEISFFETLLIENIYDFKEKDINSSGYVIHTLEASIWCLLTTNNFKEATLKAVNLGEDTDTTGAVTGGLAGLLYGINNIPKTWVEKLARKDDIEDLSVRLYEKIKLTQLL